MKKTKMMEEEQDVKDVILTTEKHLLADPHGLLIVGFKELKVLVGLDCFPAILTHIKH